MPQHIPWLEQRLKAAAKQRHEQHLQRTPLSHQGRCGRWFDHDGCRYLNFASNDYLGLAAEPVLQSAVRDAIGAAGVGAGAAHLLTGHHELHEQLEQALADWTQRQSAMLFSTGYMANLGVISALLNRGETCLQDRLNHASLIDGALLAGARLRRFTHNDPARLEQLLARQTGPCLVAVDGVFSMDGDHSPLVALAPMCRQHHAPLLVDDAHGLGVRGPEGAGSVLAAGLDSADVPLLMGTLGKAFGSFGAFVAGDAELIDHLRNSARSYIYTTASPPAWAAASLAALDLIRLGDERRTRLQDNIQYFRTAIGERGLALPAAADSPIQPVVVGDNATALSISAALRDAGMWVPAIRPPTVPDGGARLRVTLSAAHTPADVEQLVAAMLKAVPASGSAPPSEAQFAPPRARLQR